MLNPKLYRNSRIYDFFMKSLGYERSLDRFLRQLHLPHVGSLKILDAGCGTGLMGLGLLQRFPEAELVSTDLEPNFLHATLKNAASRGIAAHRLQVGLSNITQPKMYQTLDGQEVTISDRTLNLVCIGAVVGYSADIESSLHRLVELLVAGGTMVNLEMNESLTGRYVSKRYHYHNIPLSKMIHVLKDSGCEVVRTKLSVRHLPAKFTRVAIVATKR